MSDSIHSDARRTVRVSARRFETSPFQHRWETPETVMGVYAGRYYSVSGGEDVADTYWALRRRAVLYDVPERPVEIVGPDAERFLEHVLARRVATLKPGRGRYAVACTHAGGLFMDGILFRLEERRFWYVQADGALEAWLLALSEGFDVQVSDPRSRVLQIQGPASPAILRAASDGAIDETLRYFHFGFFEIGGQRVYVSRTGWTGELGYEIYTQGEATDPDRLWDALIAAGAPHGMIVASVASMEIRRIEAGILDNGTDFDATMTPYAAGLGGLVDLEKEDFVGRAALLGADRGRRLFGLRCEVASPGFGQTIHEDGARVGHVTAGAWSPHLGCGIGYARMDAPGGWAGRRLTVSTEKGGALDCEIVEPPFHDVEKRIPRGLATATP